MEQEIPRYQKAWKGNYTSVFIQLLIFTNFAIKKPIVSRLCVDISPSSLLGSNRCTNNLPSSERPQLARPGPPILGVCGEKHDQLSNGHLTWAWHLRSLRTADVFPVVASFPSLRGRATTGNASAVRGLTFTRQVGDQRKCWGFSCLFTPSKIHSIQ